MLPTFTRLYKENVLNERIQVKNNKMYDAAIEVLKKIETELGETAYIVGGSVRDIIMGKEPHDVDIATSASPEQISSIYKTYDIGKSKDFGIVVVQQDGFDFEVAQYREDGEYTDGRRPDSVKAVKNFEGDAKRRDFTINALAIDKDGEVIDYVGGLEDLKNQIIQAVGDPKQRFQEDALRILRLLRFSAKTGFKIEEKTLAAAKELVPLVSKLSVERIKGELFKSAESGKMLAAFIEKMDEIGLLEKLLPELHKMKELKHNPKHHPEGGPYQHTLEAVKVSKSNNPLTNIAILFHDIGKGVTLGDKDGQPTYYGHEEAGVPIFMDMANRLKMTNNEKEAIGFAIANHMHGHKLGSLSDRIVLRLRQNPYWEQLKDVIYSDEASRGPELWDPAQYQDKIQKADDIQKQYGDKIEFEKKLNTLINGKMIMDLIPGIAGVEIGRVKNAVRDWIVLNKFNVSSDQIKEKVLELANIKESFFIKTVLKILG